MDFLFWFVNLFVSGHCLVLLTYDASTLLVLKLKRRWVAAGAGQGHCHGLTGAMAAVLAVFAEPLGLELRYTGGFSIHGEGAADCVTNAVERHQWLEVTLQPSGFRTVVTESARSPGKKGR